MKTLIDDIRFSLRLLAKSPGFSFISILVIVIGLAVAIVNFSIVYAFTKPPAVSEGDRFFAVQLSYQSKLGGMANPAQFNDFALQQMRNQVESAVEFGAFSQRLVVFNNEGVASREDLIDITPEMLTLTKVQPLHGRMFNEADTNPTASPVVIIGYRFWRTRLAGSDTVIGKAIDIDGTSHTVIGIMPDDFFFPYTQDIWRPLSLSSRGVANEPGTLLLIGKLKPTTSWEQASLEVNAVFTRLKKNFNANLEDVIAETIPINNIKLAGATDISYLFRSITLIIFFLASLNLSTLLFTRANERQQELTIRNAIGANTWQLRKQLLIESGLLAVGGGLLAVGLAAWLLGGIQQLTQTVTNNSPMSADFDIRLYPPALLYAVTLTLAIWLISASYTVYKVSKVNAIQSTLGGSRGGTHQNKALATQFIISVEVILSCFLLILCGLFTAAIFDSNKIDYGTEPDNLFVGSLPLPESDYPTEQERQVVLSQLANEVLTEQSIEDVAFTDAPPGGWLAGQRLRYNLEDRDVRRFDQYPDVRVASISNNFFDLVGARLISGRGFDNTDTQTTEAVAVIDELLAKALWPNESAVGKRIQLNPQSEAKWLTIVGVNSHIIHTQAIGDNITRPTIYRPLSQSTPKVVSSITKVRSGLSLSQLSNQLNQATSRVNNKLLITNVMTMEDYQPLGLTGVNMMSRLFIFAALFSLILAMVGVYGIVARAGSSRAKEVGIRRALGSTNFKIIKIFAQQGGNYLLAGAVFGGGAAILLSNPLAQIFPNILLNVPWVTALVLLTLGGLIYLASFLPANQVIRMEPGDALRDE